MSACDPCLRRSWLLERMGSHLDYHAASMIEVLALGDQELIALCSGTLRRELEREYRRFDHADAERLREQAGAAALMQVCRCDGQYPSALRPTVAAPAVLHIAGRVDRLDRLCATDPVAIIGSRSATAYGLEVAEQLGGALSASGVTVISGMADGIDGRAHAGALQRGGRTLAVLPGSADRPYPAAKRRLHAQILQAGVAISETGPGARIRRWMFPARNRVIAGLSCLVVLVQARAGSGSLLTVKAARAYGRPVAAVPGSVLSPQSEAPNALLRGGAGFVRGAQDVLDLVFGAGLRCASSAPSPPLADTQLRLLAAISDGANSMAALGCTGVSQHVLLATLGELELIGRVRRGPGGRYTVCG